MKYGKFLNSVSIESLCYSILCHKIIHKITYKKNYRAQSMVNYD